MREPRLRCLLPSLREPDWDTWGKIPNAELWQIVALACALEPAHLEQWIRPRIPTNNRLAEFQYRVIEAVAALEIHGGVLPALANEAQNERVRVELGNFSAWASSVGWQLPENFPKFAAKKVAKETARERESRLYRLIETERAKGASLVLALQVVASTEEKQGGGDGHMTSGTLKKIYYRHKKRLRG